MLAKLPVRGDEMEADNIYSTLVTLCDAIAPIDGLVQELIRVYAQTLALKDKILESFHLRPETYTGILAQLRLLSSHPQYQEVVAASVSDENSRARFLQRTAP
jgi:hypothetical protein